jgi:hypothetical protein
MNTHKHNTLQKLTPVYRVCQRYSYDTWCSVFSPNISIYAPGAVTRRLPQNGYLSAFRRRSHAEGFLCLYHYDFARGQQKIFPAMAVLAHCQPKTMPLNARALWVGNEAVLRVSKLPPGTVLCESIALLPEESRCYRRIGNTS